MTLIHKLPRLLANLAVLLLAGLFIAFVYIEVRHLPTSLTDTRTPGRHVNQRSWADKYGPVCRLNSLHNVFFIVTCPEATKEFLMSTKYLKDPCVYKCLFSLFGVRCLYKVNINLAELHTIYVGHKLFRSIEEIDYDLICYGVKISTAFLPRGTVSSAYDSLVADKTPDPVMLQLFLRNGLVTAMDHDLWYKQRRIMDPAFSSVYLQGLMSTFNERAECLMTKLDKHVDSKQPAHMHKLVDNSFTLDVITKVAFGVDLGLLNITDSPFPQVIETCLKGMVFYIRDPIFQRTRGKLPGFSGPQERRGSMRGIRRRAIQNGEDVPMDILTQLLKSAEKNKQEDDDNERLMLDNFVTFFIAGQETTANQLSFAIMELRRHPEILQRAKEEVDEVLGMKQEICYEDLGKLSYLTQVLKETLRLYPTAPGNEETVINGIEVPGGCSVILSSYVSSRMEQFFKDPLTFDPERFSLNAPKPYFCYYPFALGPRSCLWYFSQMEAKVALAKLLQRFDFTLVPGQSFEILDTGTLLPEGGVMCTIKHRDNA